MHHLLALFAQDSKSQPPPGLDPTIFILLLALFGVFWLFIVRPMKQREKKERDDLFSKLKKNDEVLTASGIIGIVAMVKDDEVILKVDESANVRLRVLKSTIVRIMNPKEPAKDGAAKSNQNGSTGDNVSAAS
jgi:preprotein translocase subunit YajC